MDNVHVKVKLIVLLVCPLPFLTLICTAPAMEISAAGMSTLKFVGVGAPVGLIAVGPTMTLAPESNPVPVMATVTSALAGVLLGFKAVRVGAAAGVVPAGGIVVPGVVAPAG